MNQVEMKEFMDKVHMVKIEQEMKNMKVAASFVEWTFGEIINEVEDIVDGEKLIKHSHIQKKIEGNLEKDV
jgi:nucleosome binding factor SPN SPT16 subunit